MDRDLLFAVVLAVFGTALVGSWYFGEPPSANNETPVYQPDDIRYRLQQDALRVQAKARKRKVVQQAATDSAAAGDSSSPGDGGMTDHPPVSDHAPVGAPDLE